MNAKTISSLLLSAALPFLLIGCLDAGESSAPDVASVPAATPAPTAQTEAEHKLLHVMGDIYRFEYTHYVSMLVDTPGGFVIIDPVEDEAAIWVRDEVQRRFNKPITHVIYSHGHEDHASGASMFPNSVVISHENTLELIKADPDAKLGGRDARMDADGDGKISKAEAGDTMAEHFGLVDSNADGYITGTEHWTYMYRNVKIPTQTYGAAHNKFDINGKAFETFFLGGNHSPDMWYIYVPEESLMYIVDIVTVNMLPFGPLPWYSDEDMKATYDLAYKVNAKHIMGGHGPVGTLDDIRRHNAYMDTLRAGVSVGIEAGQTLEQLQASLTLDEFSDMQLFERRSDNIVGMYNYLSK